MTQLSPHELSRFAPSHDTHWAVILNRGYVRATIIYIRRARRSKIETTILDKRLRRDWELYRLAMRAQESERRAWRDSLVALRLNEWSSTVAQLADRELQRLIGEHRGAVE